MFRNVKIVTIFAYFCASAALGLKVTFERALLTYFNPKYVDFAFVNVTRYGRKSDYYGNIDFFAKYETTNNVSIHIYVFEFSRNQYKRSFIEFHHKMCDFILKDKLIGTIVHHSGIPMCPVPAGRFSLLNITTNFDHFPSLFPFDMGRLDVYLNTTADGEAVASGVAYLTFKNDLRKRRKGQIQFPFQKKYKTA